MTRATPAPAPRLVACVYCGRVIRYGNLPDAAGTGWVHADSGDAECADTLAVDGL